MENEHTFTPGPWVIHAERENDIFRSKSVYVCRHDEPWPHGQLARVNVQDGLGEREANAALIAAAPDLLAALTEILEYRGGADSALHDDYVIDRARAAIARATLAADTQEARPRAG